MRLSFPGGHEIPQSWINRFGPLKLRARHAGIVVLRLLEPRDGLIWLKVHQERETGDKEEALLRASLPLDTPKLQMREDLDDASVLLGMDDARAGRDQALMRIPPAALAGMAQLLGKLSRCAPAGPPAGRQLGRLLRRRLEQLPKDSDLHEAFEGMLLLGDGLCHGDLHPSNWLMDGGRPVGLLDWTATHFGDPEWDLARLLAEADLPIERLDEVVGSWEAASGLRLDRKRLLLYSSLEGKIRGLSVRALARASEHAPPVLGARPKRGDGGGSAPCEAGRKVPATWVAQDSRQEPIPEMLGALAGPTALGRGKPDKVSRFGRHACNLVLRLDWEGQDSLVIKAYRKPVPPWLFELEARLAEVARGSSLAIPAPRVFGSGSLVFRSPVGPAACYPLMEGRSLRPVAEDADRLALSLARFHAFHRELPQALRASLPQVPFRLEPEQRRPSVDDLGLDGEALQGYERAWFDLQQAIVHGPNEPLPEALLHGSMHRDHTAVTQDERLVVYDLEKVACGPRVLDLVQSATYLAYRNRDERPSPELWVYTLRAYHRAQPLEAEERDWLLPLLMRCLFVDFKHMRAEGFSAPALRRHLRALLNFHHNRNSLAESLRLHLA